MFGFDPAQVPVERARPYSADSPSVQSFIYLGKIRCARLLAVGRLLCLEGTCTGLLNVNGT